MWQAILITILSYWTIGGALLMVFARIEWQTRWMPHWMKPAVIAGLALMMPFRWTKLSVENGVMARVHWVLTD